MTRGIPGSGILATTIPGTVGTVGNITVATPKGDVIAGQGGIAQLSFNGTPNLNGLVNVTAGSPAGPNGEQAFQGSVRAGNSGIIGGNIRLRATGDIEGVVVAQGSIDLAAGRNVVIKAISGGTTTIVGASVSGTVASSGSVNVEGGGGDINVTANSGNAAKSNADAAGPAPAASQAAAAVGSTAKALTEEVASEKESKKANLPAITRTRGRVTVILSKL